MQAVNTMARSILLPAVIAGFLHALIIGWRIVQFQRGIGDFNTHPITGLLLVPLSVFTGFLLGLLLHRLKVTSGPALALAGWVAASPWCLYLATNWLIVVLISFAILAIVMVRHRKS